MKPVAVLKCPPSGTKSRPFAKITTQRPGHRLAPPEEEEVTCRLPAAAVHASPSSEMTTAALEQWSGEAICLLLRLVE